MMIKNFREKVFSDSPINNGRQHELDLARAVVVFFLAYIHLTIECSTDEALGSGIPYLFDTIIGGSFSAPMYMFVMGVGMFYTTRSTPKDHFIRGAKILALSYVFNICRFLIPSLIGYGITGEAAKYLQPLPYKVLGNDILTFAGIAMMLMALLLALRTPKWVMLALAFATSALGTLLNGVDVKNDLGNIFLGYLIGTEDAAGNVLSDFPLLNWLIFPLVGYLFAGVLVRVKDKKAFYLSFTPVCAVFTAVYYIYGIKYGIGMFGEGQNCYYHMVFTDAIVSLTLTFGLIGIYYFLSLILPQWILRLSGEISQNITPVYCIHWVFVFVIADLVLYIARGSQILTSGQILLLGTVISIISIVIAHYFGKFMERRKQEYEEK